MRLGLVLDIDPRIGSYGLARQARAAEAAGIELAWLEEGTSAVPPLIAAAILAPQTRAIRLTAVLTAGPHPLSIAEAATVVDNCTVGRLGLVVNGDEEDLLEETVTVLTSALAGRPFRHRGARWSIPANRPENDGSEHAIVVTPLPAQLEMPLWLGGTAAPPIGRRQGRSHLATSGSDPAGDWSATERALGAAARRLARPAAWDIEVDSGGGVDSDALVARILSARAAWGLDVAVLRPPAGLAVEARERLARHLGSYVRPRIVLDRLPEGIEQHWRRHLPDQVAAIAAPGDR
jgi:alkanesulfonate monooxygenase SsuD/methylene tetrahydromethanopterin reductase-like flavin-dependent oxidoreductase (luciferase family)